MRFIKELPNVEIPLTIVWDKSHKAYKFDSGDSVGIILYENHDDALEYLTSGLTGSTENDITAAGYELSRVNITDYRLLRAESYNLEHRYISYVQYNSGKMELPYGVFEMKETMSGEVLFRPYKPEVEKVTLIKNKDLRATVEDFFTNKSDTGRKDKLGILSYGPPGNGKTTEIMQLFSVCEELKLRIFIISSGFSIENMNPARHILNGENNIFVLEEVTERLSKRGVEEILTFLDGENSWTNSITVATTNYPEDMPANLVDRPGRFELFVEYTNPTNAEITELGAAFGFAENDVSCLFGDKLSFDYVSFILSKAKKAGKPVKETREFEEAKRKRLSSTFKGKIGF